MVLYTWLSSLTDLFYPERKKIFFVWKRAQNSKLLNFIFSKNKIRKWWIFEMDLSKKELIINFLSFQESLSHLCWFLSSTNWWAACTRRKSWKRNGGKWNSCGRRRSKARNLRKSSRRWWQRSTLSPHPPNHPDAFHHPPWHPTKIFIFDLR